MMLPGSIRIYLSTEPTDMRNAMDGLAARVRRFGGDPLDGSLYVFLSKRRDRAKILAWTRGGYIVWYKRLEKSRFKLPPVDASSKTVSLDAAQLTMLLDGIDLGKVKRPAMWQPKRIV